MNFGTKNPYQKCFYNEKDESAGWVELRTLNPAKAKEIAKKTITKKVEFKRRQRFEVEVVDDKLKETLTWDYCIGNWENTCDESGLPIENNAENKVELMNTSNEFAAFVASHLERISEEEEKFAENEVKN